MPTPADKPATAIDINSTTPAADAPAADATKTGDAPAVAPVVTPPAPDAPADAPAAPVAGETEAPTPAAVDPNTAEIAQLKNDLQAVEARLAVLESNTPAAPVAPAQTALTDLTITGRLEALETAMEGFAGKVREMGIKLRQFL